MTASDRPAAYKLVENGTLVAFDVTKTDVQANVDGEEAFVRIDLQLGEVEDDDRSQDQEWGAFGFIFVLACMSFHDARPRGVSGAYFEDKDELTVADFFECLRYERGELRFSADYIRGRCLKTDVTVKPDGAVVLETRCRGESATRWLDRLNGKKHLTLA